MTIRRSPPPKRIVRLLGERLEKGLLLGRESKPRGLLIAAEPKSGSSYLRALISNLPGMRAGTFVPEYGQRPQVPTRETIRMQLPLLGHPKVVAREMCKADAHILRLSEIFDLSILVHTRSLFDIIVSRIDHLSRIGCESSIVHLTYEHWKSLSSRSQLQYVCDYFVPWHLDFRVSWLEAAKTENKVKVFHSNFEETLFSNSGLSGTLAELGFNVPEEAVRLARSRTDAEAGRGLHKFNVGKRHRGRELVRQHPWVRSRVEEMIALQPAHLQQALAAGL